MRSDKQEAIKLRKSGNSYSQISDILKVPKSTLSYWLKDVELSAKAKNKIQLRVSATSIVKLIERNKAQSILSKERHQKMYDQGRRDAKKFLSNPLFILGVSLYWAEGYKQGAYGSKWKSIDFANSDYTMIQIMTNFFVEFLKVNKSDIKVQLMIHNKKDIDKAVIFWHKITEIPIQNFIKTSTQISSASKKTLVRKLTNGTIHLRINNVNKFFNLIGWIDEVKERFI